MTNDIREQVSAWVDDELNEHELDLLVRRLTSRPELAAQAATAIRIGQSLRGERSQAGADFAAGVAAALDDEPAFSAMATSDSAIAAGSQSRLSPSRWLRPVLGGGIAAAVAAAVVMLAPGTNAPIGNDAAATAIAQPVAPVAAERPAATDYTVPANSSDSGLIAADPELAAYFLNHSRTTGTAIPANGRMTIIVGAQQIEDDEDTPEEGASDTLPGIGVQAPQ